MAPIAFLSVTMSGRGPAAPAPRRPPEVVVCLRGEHDLSTVDELSATMVRGVALGDADLVVDLSRVEFMSVATVNTVIGARDLLRAHDRSLTVRSPSRCARRVLELCDLSDLIDPRFSGAVTGTAAAAAALGAWVAEPAIEGIDCHTETFVLNRVRLVAGSVGDQSDDHTHRTAGGQGQRRSRRGRLRGGRLWPTRNRRTSRR
jgi:anti-anti-sigma factor